MQKSYTQNFIKIYLWQGISLVLNFFSMFVVIPYLTSDPITYGIYSVSISFSIFLAYADLGFIGAGQKYAAEFFAKGDKKSEIKLLGFTTFVLSLFLLCFIALFIILCIHPRLLVNGIENKFQESTASSLFLILAIFTPITLLQRLSQMIFSVRMEDFVVQRINIQGNLIKILSVFYFFQVNNYNIVGYFFFTQLVNLFAALVTLFIARKRYQFDFVHLFRSFKFDEVVFNKIKGLAFASLFLTISWILYYELDSIAIANLFGAKSVAIYAIGLTILGFFRSILGILFSPFNIRFNHFIGGENEFKLKEFVKKVITIFAPVVMIPILIVVLFSKSIVITWVGDKYLESVEIIQILVLCNLFAFISYPIGTLIMAREQQKQMYIVSLILPLIFWIGILLTIKYFGLRSFAYFKLIAFLISLIFYYKIMLQFLNLKFYQSLLLIFKPVVLPILFLIFSSFLITEYLPTEKSKFNLMIISFVMGFLIVLAFIIQYYTSRYWKTQVLRVINALRIQ